MSYNVSNKSEVVEALRRGRKTYPMDNRFRFLYRI